MLLGRVIGTVVPAIVANGLEGTPMLWVQPLDRNEQAEGDPIICADGTRMSGPGQLVYWVASREAALTLEPWFVPIDHAVVGLADDVKIDGETDARSSVR